MLDFRIQRKSDHQEIEVFSREDDIEIEISLKLLKTRPRVDVGYALYESGQNISLWWSFNIDFEPISLKTGEYIFRTTIPKGILNARSYRIDFIAGIYDLGWIIPPDEKIGRIFKVEGGAIGTMNFSSIQRQTVLMPLFRWDNELITRNE